MKFWRKSIYQRVDQSSHLRLISPGIEHTAEKGDLSYQLTKVHTYARTGGVVG